MGEYAIQPLGDSALLIQLGDAIDAALNQRVHALSMWIESSRRAGIIETVPAYSTLLVHYDPLILTYNEARDFAREKMDRAGEHVHRSARLIEVPVRYGGASGADLAAVASSKNISALEAARIHSEREYIVYMMGFTPGFPYMGKLDERLIMPRMETPRTLVKAGTVAIAGEQTGIYPLDSPGGWHCIGWTELKLFDPSRDAPFLFAPGDRARFIMEDLS